MYTDPDQAQNVLDLLDTGVIRIDGTTWGYFTRTFWDLSR